MRNEWLDSNYFKKIFRAMLSFQSEMKSLFSQRSCIPIVNIKIRKSQCPTRLEKIKKKIQMNRREMSEFKWRTSPGKECKMYGSTVQPAIRGKLLFFRIFFVLLSTRDSLSRSPPFLPAIFLRSYYTSKPHGSLFIPLHCLFFAHKCFIFHP